MKQQPLSIKIGSGLFAEQIKWTAWFIGITFFVHIAQMIGNIIGTRSDSKGMVDYFSTSHISGIIYMLVIGIIAAYAFIPYYVQYGMTRRDVVKGSVLAAIGISIILPIILLVLNFVEIWLIDLMNLPFTFTEMPDFIDEAGSSHIVASIVLSIIDAPSAININLGLALLIHSLNLFFFYVIGYFITTGFYRYNWIIGLGYIAISIVLISLRSMFWGTEAMENINNWLPFGQIQLSNGGFIIASILLSLLVIVFIRLTTKNMTIKM